MNSKRLLLTLLFFLQLFCYGQNIPITLKQKYQEVTLLENPKYKLYKVEQNGKYGVVNEKGNEIIPCTYESIMIMHEGISNTFYILSQNNGKYGCFDLNGKEMVPCKYDYACLLYDEPSEFLYAKIENNGKSGICSINGKEIISCKYDGVSFLTSLDQWYFSVKNNEKYGLCLMNGEEIIPCIYDQAYILHANGDIPFISVVNNKKYGLCNFDGKLMVPCKYDMAILKYNKEANYYYSIIQKGDKFGICTLDGKETIPCIWDRIGVFCNEDTGLLYILKCKNDKYGVSDINGKEIIPCDYSEISMFYDEETKSNYYGAYISYGELETYKKFNLSGNLLFEKTIEKSKLNNHSSRQNSELTKLEKTTLVLQMLLQGMQCINSYTNTYTSGNIYSRTYNTSLGQKRICSFCHGTGYNPGKERPAMYSYSEDPMTGSCEICGDKSTHYHEQCPSCRGKGYL